LLSQLHFSFVTDSTQTIQVCFYLVSKIGEVSTCFLKQAARSRTKPFLAAEVPPRKEISTMAGSGAPQPNRIVTFLEVIFRNFTANGLPDPYTGFVDYGIPYPEEYGSLSITRSDGKVLSFEVARSEDFVVAIRENVIVFSSTPGKPWDEPFL
jgi:hypothetical protein